MRYFNSAILLIAVLFLTNLSVSAQETELKVVDEVIAQVNDSVITLSGVKREINDVVLTMVAQGAARDKAEAEVNGKMAELIANIVNEELLLQKGKELGVEAEVEAEINQRFRQKMQEMNVKSIEKLYEIMRTSNVEPDAVRDMWRKELTRDIVLQKEVDSRVYFGWTSKEMKEYFEKNKAKFIKPETVTLSEIFLSLAGVDKDAAVAKANRIVREARAGTEFSKLALENSEREGVDKTKGKVGSFTYDQLKNVSEKIVAPLKATKVGDVTEPIILDEGIYILLVEEKKSASSDSVFDETEVRRAMTVEKIPDERRKYLTKLRQEAYIKINPTYRPMVAPLLFAEERKTDDKKTDEKKSNK